MLEPQETKPESASNPFQQKHTPSLTDTHTHTMYRSALFSLKTGSYEQAGVVSLNVCAFV